MSEDGRTNNEEEKGKKKRVGCKRNAVYLDAYQASGRSMKSSLAYYKVPRSSDFPLHYAHTRIFRVIVSLLVVRMYVAGNRLPGWQKNA